MLLPKIIKNDINNFMQNNTQIFLNEKEFQMSLAIYLKNSKNYDDVRLEYSVPGVLSIIPEYFDIWGDDMKVEIVVVNENEYFPIELKYKTRIEKTIQSVNLFGETFFNLQQLKNQSAQNIGLYDFWKDVKRIELLIGRFSDINQGICILLTNDSIY